MDSAARPYPVIRFLLRWGSVAAAAAGILAAVATAAAILFLAAPLWLLPAAIIVGAVIWALLKSYVEVLAIISETLLPR
jgi:hypothetical protein